MYNYSMCICTSHFSPDDNYLLEFRFLILSSHMYFFLCKLLGWNKIVDTSKYVQH